MSCEADPGIDGLEVDARPLRSGNLLIFSLLLFCSFNHWFAWRVKCMTHHLGGYYSLTNALVPWWLSLAEALRRVLIVPHFFHLTIMEATVLLEPSMQPRHVHLSELCRQFLQPHVFVLLWFTLSAVRLFQIMSKQLNLLKADSNYGVETSQRWSREMGGTWTKS